MFDVLLCTLIFEINFSFMFCFVSLSKSSAEEHCLTKGGLLTPADFSNNVSSLGILNGVTEKDQTIWISGFAKYSSFVSWLSCVEDLQVGRHPGEHNYSDCVEFCNKNKYPNVGLKNHECYCLLDKNIRSLPYRQCDSIEKLLTGENISKINIFKILKTELFESKVFQQCVAAKKFDNVHTHVHIKANYTTHNCISSSQQMAIGYICEHWSSTAVKCENHAYAHKKYCIKNSSLNWDGASGGCRDNNARLVGLITDRITQDMAPNTFYWTGIFRYFSIVEDISKSNEDTKACLSVRKQNESWKFEPDDCSASKTALCYYDLKRNYDNIPTSTSKRDTKITQITQKNDATRNVTHIINILTKISETRSSKLHIILVASVLAFLFVAVVSIVAFVRCRKASNGVYSKKEIKVTENDTPESITQAGLSDTIEMERTGHLEIYPSHHEAIPFDTEPNYDVTRDTTGENIYNRTSQKNRGSISFETDQQNIYSHTTAVCATSHSSENIYDTTQASDC